MAFSTLGAAGLALLIALMAGKIARTDPRGDLTMNDILTGLRRWFDWGGFPAACLVAVTAVLAFASGINIAIANAIGRAESYLTVRDAIEAENWYSTMRRIAFLAAVCSLTLSIVTAPAVGRQSVGLVGLLLCFSVGSIALAAAVRGRADTAVDQVRSRAYDERRLRQIEKRASMLQGGSCRLEPISRLSWSSMGAIAGRAATVAVVEVVVLLLGVAPWIKASVWQVAVVALLFFGIFFLTNGFAYGFAVERWVDVSRPVRWYGVSWVSPVLRGLTIGFAIEILREGLVYPDQRYVVVFVPLLLSAVPTWILLWRTNPRRNTHPGRPTLWAGDCAWQIVRQDLCHQRDRILNRYPGPPPAPPVLVGAGSR